jgi:hypothetical protein
MITIRLCVLLAPFVDVAEDSLVGRNDTNIEQVS